MTLNKLPAAVVFDMDGLLFDTEPLYEEAAIAAAAKLGCEMTRDFFLSTIGSPWPATRVRLLEHYGENFAVDVLQLEARRHFQALVNADLPLKPGVLELLDMLDELGLPKAIATSNSHTTVQHHLRVHALTDRFASIVTLGDYERHKPAPDPFLKAAERLGVAPHHCVALEDSHNGVRSASSAGMITIMIPDLVPPSDEIRSLCSTVVVDLHEVCRLIGDVDWKSEA
jgi:HAD superfamily hydrolase (TIGR01509 family)